NEDLFEVLGPRAELERAPREAKDFGGALELLHLAHVHVPAARAVHHVDNLGLAIARHPQPRGAGVDSGIKNCDFDAAAVPPAIAGYKGGGLPHVLTVSAPVYFLHQATV
ncbi:MAG: hypothetical protein ACK55Z_02200, partial [bacterium]